MLFIYTILSYALRLYSTAIIVYILMSWFPGARDTGFGRFLESIVEPFLAPFRKIIPPIGFIDISPIVAILLLDFAPYGLEAVFRMLGLL